MNISLNIVILGTVCCISACGYDSVDNDSMIDSITNDAAIELSQLGNFVSPYGQPLIAPQDSHPNRIYPGSIPPSDCTSGSATINQDQKHRDYEYYEFSREVDFSKYEFDDCQVESEEFSSPLVQVGSVELGVEQDQGNDPTNLVESYGHYAVYGNEEVPYVVQISDNVSAEKEITESINGSMEWRSTDYNSTFRSSLSQLIEQSDGQYFYWQQGTDEQPLIVDGGLNFISFDISGGYEFGGSGCVGGKRTISGTNVLPGSHFFNSPDWKVVISRPLDTLEIVFHKGGATVEYSSGEKVKFDEQRVRQLLENPLCSVRRIGD